MRRIVKTFFKPLWYLVGAWRCLRAQFRYLAFGKKMASFELQNERRAICTDCPIRDELKCGDCGCFLAEKIQMEHTVCPIGEW